MNKFFRNQSFKDAESKFFYHNTLINTFIFNQFSNTMFSFKDIYNYNQLLKNVKLLGDLIFNILLNFFYLIFKKNKVFFLIFFNMPIKSIINIIYIGSLY